MKLRSAFPLLLLGTLAGPALADSTTAAMLAEACPLNGPLFGATEKCKALREYYRAEVRACMDQIHAEANARAGQVTATNSHGYRARRITCDAATRAKLGPVLN